MLDHRPSLDSAFRAFGVPATVMPAGGAPITATVLWEPNPGVRPPVEAAEAVLDSSQSCSMRRSEVAVLPLRSTLAAPWVKGGPVKTWRVDRVVESDAETLAAIVHEEAAA